MNDFLDTYIYNALDKEVHFKALGNHFTMRPGQIKRFNKDIGDFIAKEKSSYGLVALDNRFEELEFKESEEGKVLLKQAKEQGLHNRLRYLKMIVDNFTISLPQDLASAEMKVDHRTLASDGEIAAMEEMRQLQRVDNDKAKLKLEKVRALETQLQANKNSQVNKKD